MEFFKHLTLWQKRAAAGIIGGAAGFAYYYYIGCVSGTCPLTSNPYITTIYGAAVGMLMPSSPRKNDNGNNNTNNTSSTGQEV